MPYILGRTQERGKKNMWQEPPDSERHRVTEEALRTKRKLCKRDRTSAF
jgi:hypothetical protein